MENLVTIQTFDNYFNANIQLTRLRAAGIECYLKDEYTITIDPLLSTALGGIKLMVRKSEAEKVLKLIREMNASADAQLLCPRCGSSRFIQVPKRSAENIMAAIATWIFSSYAVSVENVYQCMDCGYESETLPVTAEENYEAP